MNISDFRKQYYATELGCYDEVFAGEKKALPYWERFMEMLEVMGGENLEARRKEAQRLLRENGVTYNVYGDAQNLTRPWRLDPVPLLIGSEDWSLIEAGLQQRAELFNLILKDIYGKQMLIKKGWLPNELIFGHDGFLHPCYGALPNLKRPLALYSANLARGPNGHMWVLNDRIQAPSGFGYALENRMVMARVLPDIYRTSRVRRLSAFFNALRNGLTELAPHNKDDPRIVILTPGPLNETYFEHAYLAAYLGYTLVQGGDLTVRDGRVSLKSLVGLQPVDVILRRVDDSYCDPLELLEISHLGTAGLLESVRRGQVAVANPLGAGILENPGLLAFLPKLAQFFLSEELKMPSVATWWCGQAGECEFVLKNLERLVIKSVNRRAGNHAVFGGALDSAQKDRLKSTIKARPYLFVGQEQVSFSTLPVFINNQLVPRNAVLRTFAVASGDGYVVMPGGLTRVALQKDNYIVSNQFGGISKDTWVVGGGESAAAWATASRPPYRETAAEPLTSRAADNLFWTGRHLERIESSARLFRTLLLHLAAHSDAGDVYDPECLKILIQALRRVSGAQPEQAGGLATPEAAEAELMSLAKDSRRLGSLSTNMQAFVQSAFSIRDFWSQDTWRSIDNIRRRWQLKVVNSDISLELLQKQLHNLINTIIAFSGLIGESMTREMHWLMLDSGRRLERALAQIAFIRSALLAPHEEARLNQILEAFLVSTDSLTIYQRRYRSYLQLPLVLELLLLDESHPRSVIFQLQRLSESMAELPTAKSGRHISEHQRLILKAYTDLRLTEVNALVRANNGAGLYHQFEFLLQSISDSLRRLSDVIAETYFSHSQMSQLIVSHSIEEEP